MVSLIALVVRDVTVSVGLFALGVSMVVFGIIVYFTDKDRRGAWAPWLGGGASAFVTLLALAVLSYR